MLNLASIQHNKSSKYLFIYTCTTIFQLQRLLVNNDQNILNFAAYW